MIPLTFLEYELNEQPDKILSRLKWAVEEVEFSWLNNFNNWKSTSETHKNWIGEINRKNLNFSLEEPGPFFKRKFNVVLKGKLELKA